MQNCVRPCIFLLRRAKLCLAEQSLAWQCKTLGPAWACLAPGPGLALGWGLAACAQFCRVAGQHTLYGALTATLCGAPCKNRFGRAKLCVIVQNVVWPCKILFGRAKCCLVVQNAVCLCKICLAAQNVVGPCKIMFGCAQFCLATQTVARPCKILLGRVK